MTDVSSHVTPPAAPAASSKQAPKATEPLRDRLLKRKVLPPVATVEVPGFGPVGVRRLTTAQAIDVGTKMDLVAKTIVDEKQQAVFADEAEVKATDWALVQALIKAADSVNELGAKVDDAAKN